MLRLTAVFGMGTGRSTTAGHREKGDPSEPRGKTAEFIKGQLQQAPGGIRQGVIEFSYQASRQISTS